MTTTEDAAKEGAGKGTAGEDAEVGSKIGYVTFLSSRIQVHCLKI